ncbi:DNA polymerase alpha catalytic subunit isoform X2 [Hydra vulgaris]|uniref:DNA polymerase n=1 Tax=Hydra vulgaris TaxID=6087 RepID=A0ABM4DAZ7_HYDVU
MSVEHRRERSERRSGRNVGKESSAKKLALEKLKKYHETGEKIEYEVGKEEDVYELVDEDKYAQLVQDRQEEEWIVDDDGGGYVDDGREIFDDDPNEIPIEKRKKTDKESKGSKIDVKSSKITNLFKSANCITKRKKETNVTVEGDTVLEDILNSITSATTTSGSKCHNRSFLQNKTQKHSHSTRNIEKTLKQFTPQPSPHIEEKKIILKKTTRVRDFTHIVKKENIGSVATDLHTDINQNKDVDTNFNQIDCETFSQDTEKYTSQNTENNNFIEKVEDQSLIEDGFNDEFSDEMVTLIKETDLTPKTSIKQSMKFRSLVAYEDVFDKKEEPLPDTSTISSSLPTSNINGDDVLRFFWLDAYEDRFSQPGTVYLFGKVWNEVSKCYVSCCVAVKNIDRQLYILPRKMRHQNGKDINIPVDFKDVYEELHQGAVAKNKIMEFKCRKVLKKYAFDKVEVPYEAEYLELVYSADQPQLQSDLKGETFSHIFGSNTTSLELLFLNQKLQGPSWIDVKFPQIPKQAVSWCRVEAFVDRPTFITVVEESIPPPPLIVLSLSMLAKTSKTNAHEIISICGLVNPEVFLDRGASDQCFKNSFCFVTKPSDQLLPYDFQSTIQKNNTKIQVCASERSMLGLLLAKILTIDPDVIVGHDIQDFVFDVLLHRLDFNKIPHWSKIGRLKRANMPKHLHGKQGFNVTDKVIACGRLVCDIKISAKELIRCKSYDLTEICSIVLKKQRSDLLPEEILKNLQKTENLLNMLNYNRADALYQLQLMYELNILPLAYQITGICGNVMSRTLLGGRSERNEYLLLHAFFKKNYILPDKSYGSKKDLKLNDKDKDVKQTGVSKKSRKKPTYAGGLVLEPKKGFYDKYILLLDFNSLYPSIIQEYNICFTTVSRETFSNGAEEEEELPSILSPDLEAGVLPTELKRLVERRKQVKQLLKTAPQQSDLYLQYDIRQKALKLTANSMYGCLGFSESRFYAKPLAALVTLKGREILMKTKDLAQALGLEVIYGDTDSIMINTNSNDLNEVRKIGSKVKSEVNKLYKTLEIDIDGIFKSMLLLKKKKYAAVVVEIKDDGKLVEHTEMKGLDIVRRDWCGLAKDSGSYVINEILSSKPRDVIIENIHEFLRDVAKKLSNGEVEMEKFEINKCLTKNPDEYPDKKSLPHVTVALRLMAQGRRVAVGDTITYIICDDNSKLPATQRAYHPEECLKNSNLKIDYHYYLSNQVHPVVSRLCDPIEGTDSSFIAECLGLDPTGYKSPSVQQDEQGLLTVLMTDEERFKDIEKFFVRCNIDSCSLFKQEVEFKGSFDNKVDPFVCSSCNQPYHRNKLHNCLKLFIRSFINRYYSCWMSCDDRSCGYVSRHISVKSFMHAQICNQCGKRNIHVDYSDTMLYNQLIYLSRLFDVNKTSEVTMKRIRKQNDLWQTLYNEVEKTLKLNAYSTVNIGDLFK